MHIQKWVTISFVLSVMTCLIVEGQSPSDWQMKPIPIRSQWADDVSSTNVLPEYPRPQMVRSNSWQNLNGLWNYVVTENIENFPSEYTGKILVPYPIESALSGVKKALLPNQRLWYQRYFTIKPPKIGRILIHFGAVDYKTWVYINGQEVGVHEGGYTDFSFDITDVLREGQNEVIVKVYDPSDQGVGPHGKQVLNPSNIYYTPSSGIWQTVWLESVPVEYINNYRVTPDIDRGGIFVQVRGAGVDSSYKVRLRASNGDILNGAINRELFLPVPQAHLWSPDDPYLYDLEIELLKGSKVIDRVKGYFGMRKIDIQKDEKGISRIFLNNKYTYNLGTLDQGFWPEGLYTAPTDEALAFDIKIIKVMGFNTIRKHIKVEPARWYYHADKIGMLVWQDFVNPNQGLPEGAKEIFEQQIKETLTSLHNYPCIVAWVIFNEKWGAYDQKRITEWVKKVDPSRLVNGHSGELLYVNNQLRSPSPDAYISADMTDVHSYPFPRLAPVQNGKANVLGEFGGIGVPVNGHLWDDLAIGWGYDGTVTPLKMEKQFKQMMDTIRFLEQQGLTASIYTQPFDVESEQNGLMTYDRKVIKIPIEKIQEINATVLPITKNYKLYSQSISTELAPENGVDFAGQCRIFNQGRHDSSFLRQLAIVGNGYRDNEIVNAVMIAYIKGLQRTFSEENLRLIALVTKRSIDTGFNIIFHNREAVNGVIGQNKAEKIIRDIIFKEEIEPFLHDSVKEPDWDKILAVTRLKYGEIGAEKAYGAQMIYYMEKADWENFGKCFVLYYQTAVHRSEYHINNISWLIFENISDRRVLEVAADVSRYNIERFSGNDPADIDTYANILYKLGKKQDAMRWEEKAVQLSRNGKEFVETLNKMGRNIPTWK